jgi:separase
VVPLSEGSLWFGHRYAEVLLQLGQAWAARGAFTKALHYMECAAQLSDAPPFLRSCETAKLSLLLSLQRRGQVDALLKSEPRLLGALATARGDVATQADALPDVRALLVRGDVCRRGGEAGFSEASQCYAAAASLLSHASAPPFVAPLLRALAARRDRASPGVAQYASEELAGSVLWRQARMLWLAGSAEAALTIYRDILKLPGCTHAHAIAHYRLGRSQLESAAQSDLGAARQHLLLAVAAAERSLHPKLLRNSQRALAASGACDSAEARSCLMARSVGAANTARMLELARASSSPPACLLAALEALQGAPPAAVIEPADDGTSAADCTEALGRSAVAVQKGVDDLPPNWVVCCVSLAPQGGLLVSRLQARRRATVVLLDTARLDQVFDGFDGFLAENSASLGQHSDGATVDRSQRAAWWEQRQELDDSLHAVLSQLESALGWGKALLAGDLADEPSRAAAAELTDRILAHAAAAQPRKGAKPTGRVHDVAHEGVLRACVLAANTLTPAQLIKGLQRALPDAEAQSLEDIALMIEAHNAGDRVECAARSEPAGAAEVVASAPHLTLAECTKLKVSDLKGQLGDLGLSTAGLKKDLAQRLHDVLSATPASDGAGEAAASGEQEAARGPVVLVLDERLQRLPWEGMECLRACPVSRAPSLAFVLAHGGSRAASEGINVSGAFYVLDPEGNLPRTRAALAPLARDLESRLGWEGVTGSAPSEELVGKELVERGLLLYCGHGAGERLIRREVVAKLPRCAAVLLMGCSSGQLHLQGDFEPSGMAAAYFSAGCPALVANLWDVTDKDIDRFTEEVVGAFTAKPARSLMDALAAGRDVCKFRGLTGFAPVCYGVPVRSATAK